ncbi:MAG: hypothetical protein LPJ87_00915 [Zoogloeaceae bacterium]|nr:hypothetical protein [Zoogloeaceae bacterium]
MHPAKTELARAALAARDPALNLTERRLLILCDGKRAPDELAALLGPETPDMLERLRERGFVTPAATPSAEPEPAVQPPAPTRSRRSAAIAKVYINDMLVLMRRDDAEAMSARLHAAGSDHEVMTAVDAALQFIAEVSGPRYARKIATRVAEVAPESWLVEPDSTLAGLSSDSPEPA